MKKNNDHTKIVLKMRFCYHLIIVYLSFRDTLFTKKQDNQASSTKSIWQKEHEKIRNMGIGKFLQNHEARRKQKWALANFSENLETAY